MKSNQQYSETSPDYRRLIIGTWEGRDDDGAMFITFEPNGNAIVDYTPTGGRKQIVPYHFKDDRTVVISVYPDDLIIHRWNDDEVSFQPQTGELREDVSMVYVFRFKRVKSR